MLNVLIVFDTTASILTGWGGVDPSVYVIRGPSNIWIMRSNLALNLNILSALLPDL
jgi:hypothetical protein